MALPVSRWIGYKGRLRDLRHPSIEGDTGHDAGGAEKMAKIMKSNPNQLVYAPA